MSEPQTHGPRLYAYLQAHWDAQGSNANRWTKEHRLQLSTVQRWRDGSDPRLGTLRPIADALGVTILDVLLAAGAITPDEAAGEAEPVAPRRVSIEEAVKADPEMSEWGKGQVAGFVAQVRNVDAGGPGGTHKIRGRRKP